MCVRFLRGAASLKWPPPPAPLPLPQALTLAAGTPTTVRLTWRPLARPRSTWCLLASLPEPPGGEAEEGACQQVQVGQPEVLLDGLKPGTDYDVQVQSLQGPEKSVGLGGAGRLLMGPQVPGAVAGSEPTPSVEGQHFRGRTQTNESRDGLG